jgi:uncharacterized Zn finger protein
MVGIVNRNCPVCGHEDLHHSRLRTFGEKLKYNLIGKLPFRCHSCGWRGWFHDDTSDSRPAAPAVSSAPPVQQQPPKEESVVGDLMAENHEQRQKQKRRA